MGRSGYVLRRLLGTVPVLFALSVLVFLMIHLVPGDPARTVLGPRAPEEAVVNLRHLWGLDEPLPTQFALFLGRLAHGDLGTSLSYSVPVSELLGGRLQPTLLLLAIAVLFTVAIVIPLATIAAANANGWPDHVVRAIPMFGLGMPTFWMAIVLILVFALRAGWFPVGGYGTDLPTQLQSLVLPGLTVALAVSPIMIRSLRAALLEVLDADYIVTARSKGLSERRVLVGHGVRNAIIPTVTVLGANLGWLVSNTVIVERVFAIPGLGSAMIDAILGRDFPVVQSLALIFCVLVVLVNVVADLVRSTLDPRHRLA
jgi:peptide/nickel transport system permease protein